MYDRDLLAPNGSSSTAALRSEPLPKPFTPQDPPDTPADENSLQSWQQLFKDRRTWAVKLSEISDTMLGRIVQTDAEVLVIRRATAVAVDNARQHISSIFQKYGDIRSWARDVLKDQSATRAGWESTMQRYSQVPIDSRLRRYFKGFEDDGSKETASRNSSLKTLATPGDYRQSAARAQQVAEAFQGRLSRLERQYEGIAREGNDFVGQFNQDFALLMEDIQQSVSSLAEEVEVIIRKINVDYENALTLPKSSKSLAAVTKTATVHSQEFLPSLVAIITDIDELLRRTIERKNMAMEKALSHMQKISSIQSAIASFQPRMAEVELNEEEGAALDAVTYIHQLPAVYGSLMTEVVRRHEWSGKMMSDSSTLAEEMAIHTDDEERRRRKWLKSVKDYLNQASLDSKALGIEVNVKNREHSWPPLSRSDIEGYMASLKEVGGFDIVLREIEESIKSLDAPSKQQVRNANAQFKNGSIHGAAFTRNSLLLRGDEELIQTLQTDKSRLEDRLKGSESRVRKLEDLLHRSSQMPRPITSRPSSSGLDRYSTSPVLPSAHMVTHKPSDTDMRRPSMGSRPVSATFGGNDKALLQKIIQLEGELEAERAKAARMQNYVSGSAKEHAELRQQVEDATSTKKDLMDNFEAQQVEFDDERRLFQDDNRKLKIRLEEMEEELDRAVGSHENTNFNLEKRHQSYDAELASLRSEAAARAEAEQERAMSLKDKIKRQENVISDLRQDKVSRDAREVETQRALHSAHTQLSRDAPAPEHFADLVGAVEMLSQRASDHLRELQLALDNARSEKSSVENRVKRHSDEILALQSRLLMEQNGANDLRQELAAEKARFQSVSDELGDHRRELSSLRARLDDHATGPDALKNRLAAEEKKAEGLHLELATATAAANQSEKELSSLREQIESLQALNSASSERLQDKGDRAGQVTLHLYTQVDRLTRVLENIGYSITREDDAMVIQRIPRSAAVANSAMVDQSQITNTTTPGPAASAYEPNPPDYLHWASVEDDEKAREDFEAFMHESQAFDMDAFSEAVVKRVKDVEHIARKWQREAKSYREKFHRAHLDSQQKIAFRSFREGDLALFLPTRNQTSRRPWAAFNVGAPHYFLREQDSHKLKARDFLLARISKVEERIVDLGKGVDADASNSDAPATKPDGDGATIDEYNPFGLSDGLRWYFLDAAEDKISAPTTPGLGKSTVASAHVDAAGSIGRNKRDSEDGGGAATKTLAKSLDSRRSSANSRRSASALSPNPTTLEAGAGSPAKAHQERPPSAGVEEGARKALPSRAPIPEEDVRRDQLLHP